MTGTARVVAGRVRSLSSRERALLLLCGAAVAAFALSRWVVLPALAEYRRDRASLPARMAEVARCRLAAEGAPRIEERIREARKGLAELEGGLLPGETAAAAGVSLQRMLKPWVERADTRVVSVRGLPAAPRGSYVEIPLQVELQTTVEGLASLLSDVQRSRRILAVRKLTVVSAGTGAWGGAGPPRRELLVATVVLSGLARTPDAEGRREGEKGGGK